MTGENIYEYDKDITGVTDYGISMESILGSSAYLVKAVWTQPVDESCRPGFRRCALRVTEADRTWPGHTSGV
jgi:hypothetical protein